MGKTRSLDSVMRSATEFSNKQFNWENVFKVSEHFSKDIQEMNKHSFKKIHKVSARSTW